MDMINRLVNVISQEAELFESFLELLNRQRQALVDNNLAILRETTEKQREVMVESHLLNDRREKIIGEIKEANLFDGDVTVTRLLEYADRNQSERLMQLKETILSLNDQIVEVRNTNALLLNQSREFIAKTMASLSKINNPEHTYANGTDSTGRSASVVVDRRV